MQFIRLIVLGLLLITLMVPSLVLAEEHKPDNPYFQTRLEILEDGTELEEIIIAGPPSPPPDSIRPIVTLADPHQNGNIHIITSVPGFNWSFGCAATSAAMIAGYYDRNGYTNMYAGSTHGGVMPMDNSYWPVWHDGSAWRNQCPLSATHMGLDGRGTRGHVDDYWVAYESTADDPFITNGWPEHTDADCTGDFMYTNQSTYSVTDGATRFWGYNNNAQLHCATLEGWGEPYSIDGTVGLKNFYESRGYTVTDCYYQKTDNQYAGGFSFEQFKAEIDAGYPVMIHVTGHTMVGFGYDDSTNEIYLRDTWDYDAHTMTWGGNYSGMDLVGVSIVHLAPSAGAYYSAQTGNWDTGSTWIGGSAPGATDSVIIQSGHTVTLVGHTQATNLAVEYDGQLVVPNGVTLSVEGALSNNGMIQQTQSVPFGTTTEFLHITNLAGTVDKYHGVDITPDTNSMGSTTVAIRGNHTGGCTTVMDDPLLYRCFEISPSSEQSATLRFWYDEDERNGQDADNLVLWHHDGGNNWSQVGTYARSESPSIDETECLSDDGRACWLEASGISDYSIFDIGDGDTPTVVSMQSFTTRVEPGFYLAILIGLVFVLAGVGRLVYQSKTS
jgi:hypothetical protein